MSLSAFYFFNIFLAAFIDDLGKFCYSMGLAYPAMVRIMHWPVFIIIYNIQHEMRILQSTRWMNILHAYMYLHEYFCLINPDINSVS